MAGTLIETDRTGRQGITALILVNVVLALLVHNAPAPGAPHDSDRAAYDDVGRHPFAPNCGWSIYCYRVLVPWALEQLPIESDRRWRWSQAAGTIAAGTLTSLTTRQLGGLRAAVVAATVAQTWYGFAFTAYDPYTPDPMVFAIAAGIAWCWMADRWRGAWILGTVGVFAKETVAVVSASCLLASLARRRASWRAWVWSSVAVALTLFAMRLVMDTFFGWTVSNNPAAELGRGSWLALWWRNNPFLERKLYLLFAPFGFGWFFAARAVGTADPRLRHLALGAIAPILALCYVQTPERALSNAFFVVAPLAGLALARAPFGVAVAAALLNGAVTAKIGSSTPWLPPSRYLMIPAAAFAVLALWTARHGGGIHDPAIRSESAR